MKQCFRSKCFQPVRQPPSGGCVLKLYTYIPDNIALMQPPSGGCVLKLSQVKQSLKMKDAAAFGRLCVETIADELSSKPNKTQPPSGGCVLKQFMNDVKKQFGLQPPSGGCVLKRATARMIFPLTFAAAFGRLCVETGVYGWNWTAYRAAAFGRLCVETYCRLVKKDGELAAAFGRLCVETCTILKF